jgi:uncharacterized Zn finger protein (UPF0148 family)
MSDLCKNCGHPLPNAAGGGLYCNNCGEPVNPPKPKPPRDQTDEAIAQRERTRRRLEGDD